MKFAFRSVGLVSSASKWMGSYSQHTHVYDLRDVLEHEIEVGRASYLRWSAAGVAAGVLLGLLLNALVESRSPIVWAVIGAIGGFLLVAFNLENQLMHQAARAERRARGGNLRFHVVTDDKWPQFAAGLRGPRMP